MPLYDLSILKQDVQNAPESVPIGLPNQLSDARKFSDSLTRQSRIQNARLDRVREG